MVSFALDSEMLNINLAIVPRLLPASSREIVEGETRSLVGQSGEKAEGYTWIAERNDLI